MLPVNQFYNTAVIGGQKRMIKVVSLRFLFRFMVQHIVSLYEFIQNSTAVDKQQDWDEVEERIKAQMPLRLLSCVQLASKISSHHKVACLFQYYCEISSLKYPKQYYSIFFMHTGSDNGQNTSISRLSKSSFQQQQHHEIRIKSFKNTRSQLANLFTVIIPGNHSRDLRFVYDVFHAKQSNQIRLISKS